MDLQLKNRVVVITGGTSGIGLATVRMALAEGARVAFCGRDEQRLDKVQRQLVEAGHEQQILARRCDVLDERQVREFADAVQTRWQACDALINNAGGGRVSTFASTTDDDWLAESRLKLFSLIYPSRAFMALLEASQQAAIVMVNSLLAVQPEPHMVATSAARASALNLTHSMAGELAPRGIRVNSILLGTVSSDQWQRRYQTQGQDGESYDEYLARLAAGKAIPLGRFGQPEEVARALLFLASPAASYTTGASLDVAGGVARQI